MKHIIRIIAVLVGLLLIFSGAIKLNDPVGTAIKLEEYFEVFATDFGSFFHVFTPLALYLSIFLSSIEIILGVALIIRWRAKLVLILLLLMMVFFTFLTFYSAWFNKVTDCGCFGDAIKLTPWQSFSKDIVLLLMIIILLVYKRYIPAEKNDKTAFITVAAATLLSLFIGIYAYMHEPFIDFRAYKVGTDLPAMMKPTAPLRYKYIMERNGEQKEFEVYPTDTTWVYKEMIPLNPEDGPKITDFSVWNDEGTFTEEVFTGNKLLILVKDVKKADKESFPKINALVTGLSNSGVKPMVLTSVSRQDFDVFRHEVNLAAPFYNADATVLKTMMRANPAVMLLKNGKVVGKWHSNDVPEADEVKGLL